MDFTITFPCRNRVGMANAAIKTFLDACDYPILIIDDNSNEPDEEYIKCDRVRVIYNQSKSGLVKMWNQALREIETEFVIIGCDKIRVHTEDIDRIRRHLQEGYACVASHLMGLFGFSKELTTRIGFFDEGYSRNGFEDTDWLNKLFVNNLALYISTETAYINNGTSWGPAAHENSKNYHAKWIEDNENKKIIQVGSDQNVGDKKTFAGLYKKRFYLPWHASQLKAENIRKYYDGKTASVEI